MKTTIFAVFATLMLSSCALLKPAATVGAAVALFPECRQALIDWATPKTMSEMQVNFDVLDDAFDTVLAAVSKQPQISFTDALVKAIDVPDTADKLGNHYTAIEVIAKAQGDATDQIKNCNSTIKNGWSALRDSDAAGSGREFLRVYGPMARSGLKLLPLLLQWQDEEGLTLYAVR